MQTIKRFFTESWLAKVVSPAIAFAIWHLIQSNLEGTRRDVPVPGTGPVSPARTPAAEDPILGPFIPPPLPAPVPIPVPGGAGVVPN